MNLYDSLNEPKDHHMDGNANSYRINGHLALKGTTAGCVIFVNERWRSSPPRIICDETWVRTGAAWHVGENKSLCYVFYQEWRDLMASTIQTEGEAQAVHVAVIWIIRNCQWLLNKHVLADQLGLDEKWPRDWKHWPHGDDAVKAYIKQKGEV